jgi:hypothetical protein
MQVMAIESNPAPIGSSSYTGNIKTVPGYYTTGTNNNNSISSGLLVNKFSVLQNYKFQRLVSAGVGSYFF